MGGSENSPGDCFPDHTDAGIRQCEHSAGGVYCGVADGGGVNSSGGGWSAVGGPSSRRREECEHPVGGAYSGAADGRPVALLQSSESD